MSTRHPITGQTRLAAVIGDPVRHSLSPTIHNAAFAALDLDWVYLALPVSAGSGSDAIAAMRTLGIEGLSVTMPLKDEIAAAVDRRSESVEQLQACNCVALEGSATVGHNTDGDGFIRALSEATGSDIAGASIAVIGAGGAARAIIDAADRAGAGAIDVINRTPERAIAAARLAENGRAVAVADQADSIADADIIVNATSIGMGAASNSADPADLPVAAELLSPRHVVADIVYQPLDTPLLRAARDRGLVAVGGVGMLIHQAAIAFELWTGEQAPVDAMHAAVADHLG